MIIPISCSKQAYQFFEDHISELETSEGMINVSLAIAMHSFDDLDCQEVWQKIDQLSKKIAYRANGKNLESKIAHLHQVLFVDEGFVALPNRQASHLLDSFLSMVIELKVGTPELVGLIYKVVAESIGLTAEPVLWNDRLYVRVHDGHGWLLVDLCNRGRTITPDRCTIADLEALPNRDCIRRMLFRNMSLLEICGRHQDHAAMEELHSALETAQAG